MYRLVNGQLLNIIEVVTPNQNAIVTTTTHSVQGYDSDVPIDIASIPDKNEPPGQIGELHYVSGALQWVYVNKPLTMDDQITQLKAEKQVLEQQAAQTSTDLAGFMDYYFTKNPEPPVA